MNTPDTEMEKAELAVFWDEMAQHLPKSIERSALGDEKIFRAFATAYPKIKKHLISSRDTYWKERIVAIINDIDAPEGAWREALTGFKQVLISAITNEDNLK